MEALLNRYRNLSVLVVVVVAQLLLLAWQVKTSQDVRLIRVWAVSTVTPVAGIVEAIRRNTIGFLEDYFILLDVREQNRRIHAENNKLKMENTYFRNELSTADRARALSAFQARTPSRTVAARVTGNSTVNTARCVFIDRGSASGIEKGMAVVTPDGIVGKVIAVYPLASQVLLVTDPTFSVGVESQRGHLRGTLNCKSGSDCSVDYIQNEEHVDKGETFFTSGEDRVFPKGFPVGAVSFAKSGTLMKEIHLTLSGAPAGAEEVLVVLEGAHQQIPDAPLETAGATRLLPPPPDDSATQRPAVKMQTEADKIKQHYEELGKDENHQYGAVGSATPNFNPPAKAPQNPVATSTNPSGQPQTIGDGGSPAKNTTSGTLNGAAATAQIKQSEPPRPPQTLGAPRQPVANPALANGTTSSTSGGSADAKPSGTANNAPANPSKTTSASTKTTSSGPTLPLGAPKPKPKPKLPAPPQELPSPNE